MKTSLFAACMLLFANAALAQEDIHQHQNGNGHTSHGNGNGYGHYGHPEGDDPWCPTPPPCGDPKPTNGGCGGGNPGQPVPEPTTMLLVGSGLAAAAAWRRRRANKMNQIV